MHQPQGPTRRSSAMVAAIAVALLAATVAIGAGSASARPAADPPVTPDAFVYVPIDGGRAVVRWNGQAAGYTLPKAAMVLPGAFDAAGGGLLLYSPGSGADGILRIRVVDGRLSLSLRRFTVNGSYLPMTGDFDGNGITDVLWQEDAFHGPASYLWLFRPDGSYRSVPFDDEATPGLMRSGYPVDANLDGITDIFWAFAGELWIMRADGSHVARTVNVTDITGYQGFAAGNIGPDDGVTRRRMVATYSDGTKRLYTFNLAGQSTRKTLGVAGPCCNYQTPLAGHFLDGQATSLFLSGGQLPQDTEQLLSITAGGNLAVTDTPQITSSFNASVGDFDGNGYDDIQFWNRSGTTFQFTSDGTGFTKVNAPAIAPRTRSFALDITAN